MSADILLVLVIGLAILSLGLAITLSVILLRLQRRKRRRTVRRAPTLGNPAPAPAVAADGQAGPRRLLVAEDNVLVALSLEVMLDDLGYQIVGPAHTLDEAMDLVQRHDSGETVDAALLDIDLHGEKVFPVADALLCRGVPVVFATGFEHDAFRESRYTDVPVMLKPYDAAKVADALRIAVGSRSTA